MFEARIALVAQLVERVLGKDEVTGSSPVSSSKNYKLNLETTGFKKELENGNVTKSQMIDVNSRDFHYIVAFPIRLMT